MRRLAFNDGWTVRPKTNRFGEPPGSGAEWLPRHPPPRRDDRHRAVAVGHRRNRLLPRRRVGVPEVVRRRRRGRRRAIVLEFEGVYRDAIVSVNGVRRCPPALRLLERLACRSTICCGSASPTRSASRPARARTAAGTRAPASTGTSGCSRADASTSRPTGWTSAPPRSTTTARWSRSPPPSATGRRRPPPRCFAVEIARRCRRGRRPRRGAGHDVPRATITARRRLFVERPATLGPGRSLPLHVPGHRARR